MNNLSDMSTIFWILGMAQTVMVTAVGVTFMVILVRQKNNTLYRLMLVISFCALVQNAGYLQEIRSFTAGEAMAGVRMEYIGGAFAATLFLMLAALYCGYTLPKKLVVALVAFDILVVSSVWTCEMNTAYYTSVSFDAEGTIPHIVLGKGWLYIVNAVMTSVQILATMGITLHSLRRVTDKKMRRNYGLLLLSATMPLLSYLSGMLSIFGGFDPVPIGVGMGVISMAIAIIFHHAFDLAEVAHENIIQDMDEALLIVDNNYNFVEANSKARALFSELANYRKRMCIQEGRLSFLFQQSQDSELVIDGRIYLIHKNEIVIEKTLTGYVYILFDITEERKQLDNMQKLKEEADKANAAKSSFLAHVSHEIRTPINAVLGMNEMILRDSKEAETLKYSRDIKNAARTLLSIINDILDSSKLESGKMEIVPVEYGLSTLLGDVYHMMVVKANDKQVALRFEIDPQLPSMLKGDDIRIRQILLNLLNNAVKYTNEGSITLRLSCVHREDAQGTVTMKYEVCDTGVGIPEEELPHLYEAFERVDLERNRSVEGTGLGINIVVQLLGLMNSTLQVESTVGKGSTFSFELIQTVVNDEPVGAFEKEQQSVRMEKYEVSFVAPRAKVLVVDDNKTNRVVVQGLLRQTQVQIYQADSGQACLEAVQKEHFDVIFMDDMMPGMTGQETLQAMREMESNLCADTPVIMLTANAMHGEKEKYLEMGFYDFLAKPIDPEQLEAMLGKTLPAALVRWSIAELENSKNLAEQTEPDNASDMELLAQVEGVNVNYARMHIPEGGLLLQTARNFCQSIPQEIENLQQLIDCISEEEYLTGYRIRVHTIKSSAATIGITELSGIASLSEKAARSRNYERLKTLHPLLLEQLEIYHDRLQVLVQAREDRQKPREKARMEEVLPLLELLCRALKERDYDAADMLMEKLDEYSYPEELREQMAQLHSQVMNLEADRACTTAEQILKQREPG